MCRVEEAAPGRQGDVRSQSLKFPTGSRVSEVKFKPFAHACNVGQRMTFLGRAVLDVVGLWGLGVLSTHPSATSSFLCLVISRLHTDFLSFAHFLSLR